VSDSLTQGDVLVSTVPGNSAEAKAAKAGARDVYADMQTHSAKAWPASLHTLAPLVPAGDRRVLLSGRPPLLPIRVLAEDEYQLLLAGFRSAGGKVRGE